jgi:hypothetical protein
MNLAPHAVLIFAHGSHADHMDANVRLVLLLARTIASVLASPGVEPKLRIQHIPVRKGGPAGSHPGQLGCP